MNHKTSGTVIFCCLNYKINAKLNALIFENYSNGTIVLPVNNIFYNHLIIQLFKHLIFKWN